MYDLRQIMKDAWSIAKKAGVQFAEALKMSWKLAKALLKLRKEDYVEDGDVTVNFWFNYGKNRAYIKRSWVSKYQNNRRYYVDLESGLIRL